MPIAIGGLGFVGDKQTLSENTMGCGLVRCPNHSVSRPELDIHRRRSHCQRYKQIRAHKNFNGI